MPNYRRKNRNSLEARYEFDKNIKLVKSNCVKEVGKTELCKDQSTEARCFSKESYYKDVYCNCGWEIKFGYAIALTLVIFEAKRCFVLLLEVFLEWQLIRFAGGTQPVILTFVDITVGLPSALIAVRTIRKRKAMHCRVRTKRLLEYLLLIIATCIILNIFTLISIGYHMSVKRETLIHLFDTSMRLYLTANTYKYRIDEMQFAFQCCGHTSYNDWFHFDWQKGNEFEEMEKIEEEKTTENEDYKKRSVPFSCCSVTARIACVHTQIADSESSGINAIGCVQIVAPVLLRIVLVAYIMTSTLIVTQTLLAFLVSRMIDGIFKWNCEDLVRSFEQPSHGCYQRDMCRTKCQTTSACRKLDKKKRRSKIRFESSSAEKNLDIFCERKSGDVDSVASIEPTVHQEHRISDKRTP